MAQNDSQTSRSFEQRIEELIDPLKDKYPCMKIPDIAASVQELIKSASKPRDGCFKPPNCFFLFRTSVLQSGLCKTHQDVTEFWRSLKDEDTDFWKALANIVQEICKEQCVNPLKLQNRRTREERSALEKKNRRILRKSFDELRKHLEVKGGRVAVLNACVRHIEKVEEDLANKVHEIQEIQRENCLLHKVLKNHIKENQLVHTCDMCSQSQVDRIR